MKFSSTAIILVAILESAQAFNFLSPSAKGQNVGIAPATRSKWSLALDANLKRRKKNQYLTTTSTSRSTFLLPNALMSSTGLQVSGSSTTNLSDAPPSEDDPSTDTSESLPMNGKLNDPSSPSSPLPKDPVSKFRKLKDLMWAREAVEDVTAAEFACSVESSEGEKDERLRRKRKRAVDYEKMLTNLNRRVADMVCEPFFEEQQDLSAAPSDDDGDGVDASNTIKNMKTVIDPPNLIEDKGMGRFAFSAEEREDLLVQILQTRQGLVQIIKGNMADEGEEGEKDEEGSGFGFELPEIRVDIPKEDDSATTLGPKLYVRDDGTVDWDGALQDRAALRKFGGAVWARINGQDPVQLSEDEEEEEGSQTKPSGVSKVEQTGGGHSQKPAVTAKIEDTPAIREARDELNRLQELLKEQSKNHALLLRSQLSEGQAVANVRLASLDPAGRTKIRLSAESLSTLEQQVAYQGLVYELERIYTYLATELGNPSAKGYVPLQDRLNVAEYGLLEGQVENCSRELNTKGSLDEDIVAVIGEQMSDFKRRLGIDYYVTGLTYDKEAVLAWLSDVAGQTKSGLMFYVKGCRLFWNDLVYCSSLIARAAQGYTLKPREVRTIRRTFKDVITFIPVVIILIIPLSPVGHVLVFGAIQRFFPDFFPSCFTEQRQNLLQLYETTEYSEFVINENFQERFTRFLEAGAFLIASKSREFYASLLAPESLDKSDSDKN